MYSRVVYNDWTSTLGQARASLWEQCVHNQTWKRQSRVSENTIFKTTYVNKLGVTGSHPHNRIQSERARAGSTDVLAETAATRFVCFGNLKQMGGNTNLLPPGLSKLGALSGNPYYGLLLVPLSPCPLVPLSPCPIVPLFPCPLVPLSHCPLVPWSPGPWPLSPVFA